MNRFAQYGPKDDQPVLDGDGGFGGLSMRLDPAMLEAGYYAGGLNVRITNNIIQPRAGTLKLPWTNQVQGGAIAAVYPFAHPKTACVFNDPATSIKWLIICADDAMWFCREHQTPRPLTVRVAGVTGTFLSADVTSMVQCFDVMIAFRGTALSPLVMTSVDNGFDEVLQTSIPADSAYLAVIPNADAGLFAQNRLFIPHGDQIAASDLLDYTRYAPTLQNFRINQGTADKLVVAVKFTESTVILFKSHSIYLAVGVTPSLNDVTLQEITREYGCIARRSPVSLGTMCVFLSEGRGVCAIRPTQYGTLVLDDLPLSEPIQPVIDRINWNYASAACGAYWNNRYYLAVPLDDARWTSGGVTYVGVNNAVLVLNLLTNSWESIDTGAALSPMEFVKMDWRGRERLVALCNDGFFNLLEETFQDQVVSQTSLGANVFSGTYGGTGARIFNVTQGLVYDFVPGIETTSLSYQPGVAKAFPAAQRFTAMSGTVTIAGTINAGITAVLKPVTWTIAHAEVAMDWTSRGYTAPQTNRTLDKGLGQALAEKRWRRAMLNLRTWNPQYTIDAISEGVNESVNLVTNRTKDRTQYDRPFDADPWVATNVNDDHATPWREDYSVNWTAGLYLGSGVYTEKRQSFQEEFVLGRLTGRSVQLRVRSTQGVVQIATSEVQGYVPQRGGGIRI